MELYKFEAKRGYDGEPVLIKPVDGECSRDITALTDDCGHIFPAQYSSGAALVILSAAKGAVLTLKPAVYMGGGVKLIAGNHKVDVYIGEDYFTSYVADPALAKPYLGPVMNSRGSSITRLNLKCKEHVHHRSIFEGIGDVTLAGSASAMNVDFWNEPEYRGCQRNLAVTSLMSGAASASMSADIRWEAVDGTPVMDEKRAYTFYNQLHSCRYIDVSIEFTAAYGDVVFGRTKEAGPLGVRVADSMRVDTGDGVMFNNYGAEGEGECWSKSAHWCDYCGTIRDGCVNGGAYDANAGGIKCGVAVFDSEGNERYPTAWHIRNYGLFAPNNLYFKGGFTVKRGETVSYNYRIVFHEGEMTAAELNNRFIHYQNG